MDGRPRFDTGVNPGGYLWWYLDGVSDDGTRGITIIAFVGSVFSPYYYWAGRKDPYDHVAINVALYGKGPNRWCMTERGRNSLTQTPDRFTVGPSHLEWDGERLTVEIEETAVPHLTPVRGRVTLVPELPPGAEVALAEGGSHLWRCLAPAARITVEMDRPGISWEGHGYFDSNAGGRPLEADFVRWDWSRAALSGGRASVVYDMVRRSGEDLSLGFEFGPDCGMRSFAPPPTRSMGKGLWRVDRWTQADPDITPKVTARLEDAPFYARSLIETKILGEVTVAVHETLDCRRLEQAWVKCLLPFRMPRRP
ncbi:MAG: carotenoid 1,2-hydratase [Alphaproteobacteria bacterium]|nr:carotenoid 1,2-hydratase [Alphaproteobacteria bacterium]